MTIDILTLFPEMFRGPFDTSILKRAQRKGLVDIRIHNIRDWAPDKHKTVDDIPYGGGSGMLIKVDVVVAALEAIVGYRLPKQKKGVAILLLSAKGKPLTQKLAYQLAKHNHLILIAGHYEGVDERLLNFIDGEVSIGRYVLTGGELPAMVITDAVVRLLPQTIAAESLKEESFTKAHILEYPQYTKPQAFRGRKVPPVLLSGNHQKIDTWRKENRSSKKL